jgi:tetratricopeptide (TPR) repeat protein
VRSLIFVAVCVSVSAYAGEDEQARERFAHGTELYNQQRYEEALAEFSEAHRLSMRPALLYNIGVTNERLGRTEAAVAAFERYLAETQSEPDRPAVELRVKELRARLGLKPTTPERPRKRRWIWGVVAGSAVVVVGAVALGVGLGLREEPVRLLDEIRPQ